MSTAGPVRIEFGPVHIDRLTSPPPYDRLLGINAPFRIVVSGREWFSEPDFPVVELAAAVSAWLGQNGDFWFDTLEATESPFIRIHRVGDNCWIQAAWQAFAVTKPLAFAGVRDALADFVGAVGASTKQQLHIDVDDLFNPRAG